MSIALTLAIDQWHPDRCSLMYVRLSLSWQDYAAFDRMRAEATPLGHSVRWYGDEGIEDRRDDAYGEPLTTLSAHAVLRHLAGVELYARPFDMAAVAYLRALPSMTPVVLWWH